MSKRNPVGTTKLKSAAPRGGVLAAQPISIPVGGIAVTSGTATTGASHVLQPTSGTTSNTVNASIPSTPSVVKKQISHTASAYNVAATVIPEEKENIATQQGGDDGAIEDRLPVVDDAELAAVSASIAQNSTASNHNMPRPMTAPIGMATPSGRGLTRSRIPGEPVMVYLRIRPLLVQQKFKEEEAGQDTEAKQRVRAMMQERFERLRNATPTVVPTDSETVALQPPMDSQAYKNATALGTSVASSVMSETNGTFSFSRVFGPEATQMEVFQTAAYPLIGKIFRGQNALIFAYGITNSGKTYTMQGTPENPGIMPNVLRELFAQLDEIRKLDVEEQQSVYGIDMRGVVVETSYLEIYQEKIYDLLQSGPRDNRAACRILGSEVIGLRYLEVSSETEAKDVLHLGMRNRIVAQTMLNSDSSRSHSVFTIRLTLPSGEVWSKMSIVDLAGAERSSKTGANGERQKETNNINTSLMQLGRCLEALRFNQMNPKGPQKVVPYRESKITQLFSDTLSGYGSMVMICNVNPSPSEFDETIHTLRYAAIAKDIKITSRLDAKRATPGASSMLSVKRNQAQLRRYEEEVEQYTAALEQAEQLRMAREQEIEALNNQVYALQRELIQLAQEQVLNEDRIRTELAGEFEREAEYIERLWAQRLRDEVARCEDREARTLERWRERLLEVSQKQQAEAHAQALLELSEQTHRKQIQCIERAAEEKLREANQRAEDVRNELEAKLKSVRAALEDAKKEAEQARREGEDMRQDYERTIERLENQLAETKGSVTAMITAEREREARFHERYSELEKKFQALQKELEDTKTEFAKEREQWLQQNESIQDRAMQTTRAQLEDERAAWALRQKEWEEKEFRSNNMIALLQNQLEILRGDKDNKAAEAINALKAELEAKHRAEITDLDARIRQQTLAHQAELNELECRLRDATERLHAVSARHQRELDEERSNYESKLEHAIENERLLREQAVKEYEAVLKEKDVEMASMMEEMKRLKMMLTEVEILSPGITEAASTKLSSRPSTLLRSRSTKYEEQQAKDDQPRAPAPLAVPVESDAKLQQPSGQPPQVQSPQKRTHHRHLSDALENVTFQSLPADIQESILKKKAHGVPVGLPVPEVPKSARKRLIEDPFAALDNEAAENPEAAVALVPVRPPRNNTKATTTSVAASAESQTLLAEALPKPALDDSRAAPTRAAPPVPPRRGRGAAPDTDATTEEADLSAIAPERKRYSTEARRRRRISDGTDDDEDTKTVLSSGAKRTTRKATRKLNDSSSDLDSSAVNESDEDESSSAESEEEEEEVVGPRKATKKVRGTAAPEQAAPTQPRRTRRKAAAAAAAAINEGTTSQMTDPFSFDEENATNSASITTSTTQTTVPKTRSRRARN